jgi:hypothetical protein
MRSALTDPTPHGGRSSPNARSPAPGDGASFRGLDQPYLPTRVRLADGRIHEAAISAERHGRLHLGLLHSDSDGYVEIAAGRRPPGGKLRITTRRDAGHFLPGGAKGGPRWLKALLALVATHVAAGDEVCVAPAVRWERAAAKPHVAHTNWLWIDVDGADGLPAVRRLLRDKPAHLVVESAGSGGVHCYWRLRSPLPARADATGSTRPAGERAERTMTDAIEAAHERLIFALGFAWRGSTPVPTVADRACKDRSRVMRLAGTVNGKTGRHARVIWADLALAPWSVRELVGELPDPPKPKRVRASAQRLTNHDDPYKRIAPAEYFLRLARIEVPEHRLVSCPNPAHGDTTPSCHVGSDAGEGWCCFGCGAAGAIYDLASVLLGGPTGQWLRGEQFRRAREHVIRTFGSA